MEPIPIFLSGERVGDLHISVDGLYNRLEAVCRVCGQTPFRLWAVGSRGRLSLGIPEPEGTLCSLKRRISQRESLSIGNWERCELSPCAEDDGAAWQSAPAPAKLFRGAFLREQLRSCEGALTRTEGTLRFLAIPYDRRRPFLLTALFCFADIRPIAGKPYAVFCFDRSETPLFRR